MGIRHFTPPVSQCPRRLLEEKRKSSGLARRIWNIGIVISICVLPVSDTLSPGISRWYPVFPGRIRENPGLTPGFRP